MTPKYQRHQYISVIDLDFPLRHTGHRGVYTISFSLNLCSYWEYIDCILFFVNKKQPCI